MKLEWTCQCRNTIILWGHLWGDFLLQVYFRQLVFYFRLFALLRNYSIQSTLILVRVLQILTFLLLLVTQSGEEILHINWYFLFSSRERISRSSNLPAITSSSPYFNLEDLSSVLPVHLILYSSNGCFCNPCCSAKFPFTSGEVLCRCCPSHILIVVDHSSLCWGYSRGWCCASFTVISRLGLLYLVRNGCCVFYWSTIIIRCH